MARREDQTVPPRPSPAVLVEHAKQAAALGDALRAYENIRPYLPVANQTSAPNVTFATGATR